jgi:hypothetical protein
MLSLAAPVAAGPLEDGYTACTRGDFATAMRLMRPLADQGHVTAQTVVGLIFGIDIMAKTGTKLSHTSFHTPKRGYFPPMAKVYAKALMFHSGRIGAQTTYGSSCAQQSKFRGYKRAMLGWCRGMMLCAWREWAGPSPWHGD